MLQNLSVAPDPDICISGQHGKLSGSLGLTDMPGDSFRGGEACDPPNLLEMAVGEPNYLAEV